MLDIGTGSGCIAIAVGPCQARVDRDRCIAARPLSLARLECCGGTASAHRVRVLRADVYEGLGRRRYDIVVEQPAIRVCRRCTWLPREHRAEPAIGLRAARAGLAIVERIVAGAKRHLNPGGILVVEVGNAAARVRRRFRELPLTWLEFERGFAEVFLLRASDLPV